MSHPTATPERVIALAAAVAGDVDGYGRIEIDLAGNRDAYARLVDTLDSLAWLTPDCVFRYQRNASSMPWERITVGGVEISGPLGFTPVSDRFSKDLDAPVGRLSERTLTEVREESTRLSLVDVNDPKRGVLAFLRERGGENNGGDVA